MEATSSAASAIAVSLLIRLKKKSLVFESSNEDIACLHTARQQHSVGMFHQAYEIGLKSFLHH